MEGTNYIDHRFPCKDMIGQILVIGGSLIAALDINGDLLYLVIRDKIQPSNCTIRIWRFLPSVAVDRFTYTTVCEDSGIFLI